MATQAFQDYITKQRDYILKYQDIFSNDGYTQNVIKRYSQDVLVDLDEIKETSLLIDIAALLKNPRYALSYDYPDKYNFAGKEYLSASSLLEAFRYALSLPDAFSLDADHFRYLVQLVLADELPTDGRVWRGLANTLLGRKDEKPSQDVEGMTDTEALYVTMMA